MYSVQNLFFDAAKMIKKIDGSAHICLIIPDLPIYMNMDKGDKLFFRLLTKYTAKKTLREIGIFDSYVLLTEYMRSYFDIDKPYVVIEGMVNKKDAGRDDSAGNYRCNDNIKYIVYTGTLTKKYGIMDLVKAFTYIKHKNYRLIICGEGEAKKDIESYLIKDKRIIFKGAVKREEALEFQRKATLLVNPRSADEEYTKYSFPSKILEYMLAGKPVLCNKLKGTPDDYDEYLLYFNTNSLEGMAGRMVEICEKSESELEAIGEKNIKYVLTEKNNIKRAAEIIQMINDAIDNI